MKIEPFQQLDLGSYNLEKKSLKLYHLFFSSFEVNFFFLAVMVCNLQ
ncbi:hypothetical protein J699_02033 [Acinetobacter sp. 1000160]|nr:hypothetical protein J699_02033 [Acinetobacter sp. 1000160]